MQGEILQYLGFSENESKLYLALLELGEGTVDEIIKIANVRRPTAYKVLRELVDKGLLAEITGKPTLFRILPPENTLESLFKKKCDEIEYLHKTFRKKYEKFLEDAQKKISSTNTNIDLGRDIIILRGYKSLLNVLKRVDEQTKNCIRVVTRLPVSSQAEIDAMVDEYERTGFPEVQNSLKLKIICETNMKNMPNFVKLVKNLEFQNQYHRHLPSLPAEFTIYDDFAAMIELQDENQNLENVKILFIQNRQIVQLLILAFESLWEKAKEFK
ncbi:hypothetical protein J7M00_08800 [bacterium]|nr:hypothetical protein [bacterium]